MTNPQPTEQKRWKWVHRALIYTGICIFIPLVYLGSAPFVVRALVPIIDSADEDGLFYKGFEVYFWPIERVCDAWSGYKEWGGDIVDGK